MERFELWGEKHPNTLALGAVLAVGIGVSFQAMLFLAALWMVIEAALSNRRRSEDK